jgi:thiol-disulfide isomerase/thioredoxin
VRVAACISLVALCLGMVGCSTLWKRGTASSAGADHAAPTPIIPRPETAADRPPGVGGLLAGQVLDNYQQKPPPTFIQVVALKEGNENQAAPIEVAVNTQGYFTILGLQPGRHYQLIARAKDGERVMAGTAYATPPNPKVVIRISEDFVTASTPPVPGDPAYPAAKGTTKKDETAKQPSSGSPSRDKDPKASATGGPQAKGSVQLGSPVVPSPASIQAPQGSLTPTRPQDFVDRRDLMAKGFDPGPADMSGPWGPAPTIQTRVPSCVVRNNTLENFALYDLDGQVWDYRRTHHGRLVLLDFFGSWCIPCRQAIPEMIDLQARYGAFGLDVVGIAYEEEGTPQEQVQRLKGLRDRMGVNYRILVGDMNTCPVKSQFGVTNFPTLVLLDEVGRILQVSQGLTGAKKQQLEAEIKWRLGVR